MVLLLKRIIWFFINGLIFINPAGACKRLKVWLLRLFGAKVGKGVVIKPNVNIKYPWFLTIGNHVWIGEKVWIDNLAPVIIQDHVTLSQGAMLLTGSHNYKAEIFDLLVNQINIRGGYLDWAQVHSLSGSYLLHAQHSGSGLGSHQKLRSLFYLPG